MLRLQKHQQEAYENVQKHFKEGDKSIVIFPTGCGKSFVSLKLMEDSRDKKILFVAPSQPIVNQMWNYICKYLSTEETDKKVEEEEQKKGRKLGIKEKAEIILPGFDTVLYQTIISKGKRSQELLEGLSPDYIICDEVHHVKTEKDKDVDDGKEDESKKEKKAKKEANLWGEATKRFIDSKNAKVLGITATPERNDGVNVAINLFDGKVASEISLIEALTSDEIPVKIPDYIPCEYTLVEQIDEQSIQEQIEIDKTVNPEKAEKMQKELEEMRKIASSGKGLKELFTDNLTTEYAKSLGRDKGKYIIFCSSIEDMKQKMQEAREWFSGVDTEPEMYAVSTKYNYSNISGEKEKNSENVISEFEDSKSSHLKLLFSVNMLDEGLHVSDISGVIMTRKTNSRIKYLQELGRGISSDKDRPVPIIFDIANNYLNYDIADNIIEILEKKIEAIQKNGDEQTNLDDIDKIKEKIERLKQFKITGTMQSLVDLLDTNKLNSVDIFIHKLYKLQELGVDVSKLSSVDTIGTLLENQKIDKEVILDVGLDLEDKIGNALSNIRSAYNNPNKPNGCIPPTNIQVHIIEEQLGIRLSLKEGVVDRFIEKLQKLKELGIDVSKLNTSDTINTLLEKQDIELNNEDIKDLKLNYKIGIMLANIRSRYKKNKIDANQIEIIEKQFGIRVSEKEKNSVDIFIEKLQKLQKLGVDVSRLQQRDTINTLIESQKIKINSDILDKEGLKLDDKIGSVLGNIRSGRIVKLDINQIEIIEKQFGIRVSEKEKNSVDIFIEKLQKLQKLGVDVSQLKQTHTIGKLLESQNISIDKEILKKEGMVLEDKLGDKLSKIRTSYNKGKGRNLKIRPEQFKIIEEQFGINLRKNNTIDKFIEELQRLQELGVAVSELKTTDTLETLLRKQNIDVENFRDEFDLRNKLGCILARIRMAYNGNGRWAKPEEEQVKIIEEQFGISLNPKNKISTQSIGQATYETTTEISDEANSVVQNLVKEKDNNPSLSDD